MKLHNVLLLFTGIFFAVFILFSVGNHTYADFAEENREYAVWLTSACYDASKTLEAESIRVSSGLWNDTKKREKTLSTFYKSLANNLSSEQNMDVVTGDTPFVLLVDNDGFYISYNAGYDKCGNSEVPDDLETINVVSSINTYTENVGGHTVRYYLNDYVSVTLSNGSYYDGMRWEVYEKLPDRAKSQLQFLADKDAYAENRTHAVVLRIEEVINYYLNTQKNITSAYNTGYNVTLPEITGEDWSRMLKKPSVISFAQGRQLSINHHRLNVYAFSGGELTDSLHYFVVNGMYYRYDRDVTLSLQADGSYSYMGLPIDGFYESMEEAAMTGAMPSNQIYH